MYSYEFPIYTSVQEVRVHFVTGRDTVHEIFDLTNVLQLMEEYSSK